MLGWVKDSWGYMLRSIFIVLLVLVTSLASAAPVRWSLEDVVFDDGGTAFGSFTYDAATNEYSDIDVATTSGTVATGGYYDICNEFFCAGSVSDSLVVFGMSTDISKWFVISFDGSLSDSGDIVQISTGPTSTGPCQNSSCESLGRNVVSGSVSAVPVPAAVWLFGSALAGLGWLRRKQASQT